MTDFERKLTDSLKAAADSYSPRSAYEAREEFLRRRSRRRIGRALGAVVFAGAATALAAFFVVVDRNPVSEEGIQEVTATPEFAVSVEQIPVGDGPIGVHFDEETGVVYVGNGAEGTVTQIDARTNEILDEAEVGGEPDDVAVGYGSVWVGDPSSGRVVQVLLDEDGTFSDLEPVSHDVAPAGVHFDVVAGEDYIWVSAKGEHLLRLDPQNPGVPLDIDVVATDVAVGIDSIWAWDSDNGSLTEVDPSDPTKVSEYPVPEAINPNSDLAVGVGGVWIADGNDGHIFRFDFDGKRLAKIAVPGTYAALALGQGSAWVVSGVAGESSTVTRINPYTEEVMGDPTTVAAYLPDIALGFGAVWVSDLGNDELIRYQFEPPPEVPEADVSPPSEDQPAEAPISGLLEDLVFVYSANGDILGHTVDGAARVLVEDPAYDLHPAISPDERTLVFQRGSEQQLGEGPESTLIELDVETGEQSVIDKGQWPVFLPDGRLVYTDNGGAPIPEIHIRSDSSHQTFGSVSAPETDAPWDTEYLTADPNGHALYWQGGWEGWSLYYMELPDNGGLIQPNTVYDSPNDDVPEAEYVGISSRSPGRVHVIRLCCSETPADGHETAEFGVIFSTEGGPSYEPIAPGLEDLTSAFTNLYAAPAGTLRSERATDGSASWHESDTPTWLMSDGDKIWIVGGGGDISELDAIPADGGIAVLPSYLD